MAEAHRSLTERVRARPLPWFLLACGAFLYLHLFKLPWTPMFGAAGGELVYLVAATRMLDGQVIYRDFFDFLPPGTHVFYFVLLKLFGVRAWIPNAVLVALGVGFAWLTVVIARKIMTGISVFLPAIIFLTFSYRLQLDASHHWFSALAALGALAVVLEARTPARLAAAGALCGLASFFTQTRGAMALCGVAAFLVWEARRKKLDTRTLLKNEGYLLAGCAVATAALFAYFIDRAGLARVLDCTVGFLLKYSTSFEHNNWESYLKDWPGFRPWYRIGNLALWLFTNLFQPFVYVACLWRYRRESAARPEVRWDRWMLIYLVGVCLLLGTIRAPNTLRLAADSLPALVLLVWLVTGPGLLRNLVRRSLWVVASALLVMTPVSAQSYAAYYIDLPAGRMAFYDPMWKEPFEWLRDRTRPGDYCLALPFFNYYLRLRDPAGVPFVTATDFTRPEQVAGVVDKLEKYQARYVLWWPDEGPDPGSSEPALPGDHLAPLRLYIRQHYRVVKTLLQAPVWERRP